jgi:hypothetical protein
VNTRLLSLILFATLGLVGCTSVPEAGAPARAYPAALPQSGTLDIQVFRRSREVEFTNTTPRAFGESTIWLNRRYASRLTSIGVGETVRLPLAAFVDENAERFRAGGFFSGDEPDVIALAQIETTTNAGEPIMLGLVTVKAGE